MQPFVSVPETRVALTHVRVVDGTGPPPLEDQTIVIENGKIAPWSRLRPERECRPARARST